MTRVIFIDRLADLIGLLKKITPDRVVRLLTIPWASALTAKNFDDFSEIIYVIPFFTHKIYHIFYPSASYFFKKALIYRVFLVSCDKKTVVKINSSHFMRKSLASFSPLGISFMSSIVMALLAMIITK